MTSLRHFAVAAFGGLAITLGVAGCMHDRPETLPGGAVMAVEGNRTLNYSAPSDGTVTVYDSNADQVLYSGQVQKGQSLLVDTDKNRITLDGQTVSQRLLHGGNQNKIFFVPSKDVEKSSMVETHSTSVERTHNP